MAYASNQGDRPTISVGRLQTSNMFELLPTDENLGDRSFHPIAFFHDVGDRYSLVVNYSRELDHDELEGSAIVTFDVEIQDGRLVSASVVEATGLADVIVLRAAEHQDERALLVRLPNDSGSPLHLYRLEKTGERPSQLRPIPESCVLMGSDNQPAGSYHLVTSQIRSTNAREIDLAHWGGSNGVDWLVAEGGLVEQRERGSIAVYRINDDTPCESGMIPIFADTEVDIIGNTHTIREVRIATAPVGQTGVIFVVNGSESEVPVPSYGTRAAYGQLMDGGEANPVVLAPMPFIRDVTAYGWALANRGVQSTSLAWVEVLIDAQGTIVSRAIRHARWTMGVPDVEDDYIAAFNGDDYVYGLAFGRLLSTTPAEKKQLDLIWMEQTSETEATVQLVSGQFCHP